MPFKVTHPLDVLSQGFAALCKANLCLRLLVLVSAANFSSITFHPQCKAVVCRPFNKRMRVIYLHQANGRCDSVSDSASHHVWLSNHIWHLLYFYFLLYAILLSFFQWFNGEPLKTWVISWPVEWVLPTFISISHWLPPPLQLLYYS